MTFRRVLVANRAAVAARVIRALRALGMQSIAAYSDADRDMPYVGLADESVRLGAAPPRESYLAIERVLATAKACGADAIHPGYGFLSENADFAQQVEESGLTFIGPSSRWLRDMGHKTKARSMARAWGLPIGAGSDVVDPGDPALARQAEQIGYPLMVKPAAGGGGIGMVRVDTPAQLAAALRSAASAAERGFGVADVYLERLVAKPRHVEIQVLGDRHGSLRHLFDRDCSVQRRNQKVIEEAPAPGIELQRRVAVLQRAEAALRQAGYDNIGTLEMLLAPDGEFGFLEMNTRLQVEHGVTEEVTGVDLVQAQIRSAQGDRLETILPERIEVSGHAIEARVCAEDPVRFFPSSGPLTVFRPPTGVRVETGYGEGGQVTPFYDSLLAKVIVHGTDRTDAIARLDDALSAFEIVGVKNNIPAIRRVLASEEFASGDMHTGLMAEVQSRAAVRKEAA